MRPDTRSVATRLGIHNSQCRRPCCKQTSWPGAHELRMKFGYISPFHVVVIPTPSAHLRCPRRLPIVDAAGLLVESILNLPTQTYDQSRLVIARSHVEIPVLSCRPRIYVATTYSAMPTWLKALLINRSNCYPYRGILVRRTPCLTRTIAVIAKPRTSTVKGARVFRT